MINLTEDLKNWHRVSFQGASPNSLMEIIKIIKEKEKDWEKRNKLIERYWNKYVLDNGIDIYDEIDPETYEYKKKKI